MIELLKGASAKRESFCTIRPGQNLLEGRLRSEGYDAGLKLLRGLALSGNPDAQECPWTFLYERNRSPKKH